MPKSTVLDLSPEEQAAMLAALRRARYGYLLALHLVWWCAAGRHPTDIAAVLFCSRSSVYRTARAYREGTLGLQHDGQGRLIPPPRTTMLRPTLRRSLVTRLKAPPRAYGWWRTRWSCATLALTRPATRGIPVAAETRRRGLHEIGWVWKRPTWVANDHDPHRVTRVARIRYIFEQLKLGEAMVFADALDRHLFPKIGAAWLPQGTQLAVMTPGTHEKHDLAGALELSTGILRHCCGPRQAKALFRELWQTLDDTYPAPPFARVDVVVDHDQIHQAKAVEQWLAQHARVTLLLLPTYGPRANPIERAFGDVHDLCTRNHTRKRLRDLVGDVAAHLHVHGPWQYQLSELYSEPAVTATVQNMVAEQRSPAAA